MSFLYGLEVAATGMRMQRTRMNVISSNMANAETTRTAGGQGPYLRREVIVEAAPIQGPGFEDALATAVQGVTVREIEQDTETPTRLVFDPGHPDANQDGYVEMPNVNVMEEMVDMITASRSYEANATAFDALKSMAQRALSLGL